jgi:exodeoxyribonuclease VIII
MLRTDISNEAYHSLDDLNRSKAYDLVTKTPLHVQQSMRYKPVSTPALLMGGCFHTAVLEPEKLSYEYGELPTEIDGKSPLTKHYKEKIAELKADYPERRWLNAKDYNTCMEMAAGALDNPVLRDYMGDIDAMIEATGLFAMEGADCRIRPDWFSPGAEVVIDLKSTMDASKRGFAKSVRQFGYGFQAYFYMEGLRRCGYSPKEFIFIAVEKFPPYASAAYRLPAGEINKHADSMRKACKLWTTCKSSGVWPGYSDDVETLDVSNSYNAKSIADIARMFNVSRTYVYKIIEVWKLETRRMGNKNMVDCQEFEQAIRWDNEGREAA